MEHVNTEDETNFYNVMENGEEQSGKSFNGDPEDYTAWEIGRAEKILQYCEKYQKQDGPRNNKKLKKLRKGLKKYNRLSLFIEEA
jgi:hypothetical protein